MAEARKVADNANAIGMESRRGIFGWDGLHEQGHTPANKGTKDKELPFSLQQQIGEESLELRPCAPVRLSDLRALH